MGPLLGIAVVDRSIYVISGPRIARRERDRWVALPSSPSFPGLAYYARSIAGRSRRDLWAAGDSVVHWDGSRWSVPLARTTGLGPDYRAVEVSARDRVWAVGHARAPHDEYWTRADLWNGTTWRHVSTPYGTNTGSMDELTDVVAVGPHTAWAVGGADPTGSGENRPLTARYSCR